MEFASSLMISPPQSPYPQFAKTVTASNVRQTPSDLRAVNRSFNSHIDMRTPSLPPPSELTAPVTDSDLARPTLPPIQSTTPPPFLEPKVDFKIETPKTHTFGSYRLSSYDPKSKLVSTVWSDIKSNPAAYLKREQSLYSLYPSAQSPNKRKTYSGSDDVLSSRPRRSRVMRSVLPSLSVASSDSEGYSSSLLMPEAISRIKRESGSRRGESPFIVESPGQRSPGGSARSSPRPRSSTPKAPRQPRVQAIPSRVHDAEVSELNDYAPPASSLPPGRPLRAVWKGAPMDLSDDPLASQIHPAELYLAGMLRLSGELYLDSKKRLFAEKVHRLKQGLPFRRTDAQKACRIDVNKASRLFEAYEKVGWLDDHHFAQYM